MKEFIGNLVANTKFLICMFMFLIVFGCTQKINESTPSIRYEKNYMDLQNSETILVYDMEITMSINGKEEVYNGHIQVNDDLFTMQESTLTSRSNKICTINNIATEDVDDVYKVKEIRCNNSEDKYYLWIKDKELFVGKEYSK